MKSVKFHQSRRGPGRSALGWAFTIATVLLWAPTSSAKTELSASLPELVALLEELRPEHCFEVRLVSETLTTGGSVVLASRIRTTENDAPLERRLEIAQWINAKSEKLPDGTRILFSPRRAVVSINALAERMADLEPLCAHLVEQNSAEIERRLVDLLQRLEQSTESLNERNQGLIAFDVETLGVIEGLNLELRGTMTQQPKTLPSPAQFGRQLKAFRNTKVAAIIHARGGDLAQPRAASRELNIPLIVLDLDKSIPATLGYSRYLEEFYQAVLNGLGIRMNVRDKPEN